MAVFDLPEAGAGFSHFAVTQMQQNDRLEAYTSWKTGDFT
jgi:hypothetical protein